VSISQYSEDRRDCLQEVCNVALGQAANALARQFDVFVTLPIPVISIIAADQLADSLAHFGSGGQAEIYAASQLFASPADGCDLTGLALVMLAEESLNDLQSLMPVTMPVDELIISTCHSMAQTCLDALSEQWGLGFQSAAPALVGYQSLRSICQQVVKDWQHILVVNINYQFEGRVFNGNLLLLFPDQAIDAMAQRLDELLA